VSKNLDQIVEELSTLTVLDLSKLKEMLENKWGVKAAAAAPAMVAMAAPAAAAAAVESTEFEVTLTDAPADKRIGVIKVLRELTGLGLKEAKEMAESAPKVVKPNAAKAEAEDIKKKLETAGGKVTLKGL
jgi:large subunit ribosomal protein L7/L12